MDGLGHGERCTQLGRGWWHPCRQRRPSGSRSRTSPTTSERGTCTMMQRPHERGQQTDGVPRVSASRRTTRQALRAPWHVVSTLMVSDLPCGVWRHSAHLRPPLCTVWTYGRMKSYSTCTGGHAIAWRGLRSVASSRTPLLAKRTLTGLGVCVHGCVIHPAAQALISLPRRSLETSAAQGWPLASAGLSRNQLFAHRQHGVTLQRVPGAQSSCTG